MVRGQVGAVVHPQDGWTPPRIATWLVVAAAVLYSSWLAAWHLNPEHDAVTAYVSELAAHGEPFSHLFRALDAVAGAAVVVAGALTLRSARGGGARDDRGVAGSPRLRLASLAPFVPFVPFVLLVVFGFATVIDAFLPLSCTPTSDLACAAAEKAGDVPLAHRLHVVTSAGAGAVAAVAMVWWWFGERRRARHAATTEARRERAIVYVGAALVAIHLTALAISLADIAGVGPGVLGAAQRVSLLALALWLPVPFLRQTR